MNDSIRYFDPPGVSPAQGLYSQVTLVPSGPTVHIAGQLAVSIGGEIVGKQDFDKQMRQVFSNLGGVLKGIGLGYNNIIKFTTYLVHSQDIEIFMRVRAELFPQLFAGKAFPPNTLLIVGRLVKEDFLLEVEAIAYASADGAMCQGQ